MKKPARKSRRRPMRRIEKDESLRALLAHSENMDARMARVERLLFLLARAEQGMETNLMALKQTDQELILEVHKTTDVVKAIKIAFEADKARELELLQKLADAIANTDASDEPQVQAALAELKQANADATAAIPLIATAAANTDPNAPPPQV